LSTWPLVLVLGGLWIASLLYPKTFAPFAGAIGIIRGAFLPVYGAALAIGVVSLAALKLVPALQPRGQGQAPTTGGVAVGIGTRRPPARDIAAPPTEPPAPPPADPPAPPSGEASGQP
ncbi:MAG: hypothetical protein IVW57_17395, partial [Ktedonobacterales bacterium]|nr:hypothetical protein [Ktedonobacterales bacterium]